MTNDMPERPTAHAAVMRRIPIAVAAVLIGGIAGYVGIYGLKGAGGDPVCRAAVDTAKRIAPLAHGEVAALTMASKPLKLPDLAFEDSDGKPKKLSDWQGKTVLVNLWATWCVPCRKEMPALDALQAKLGDDKFQVIAVNIDTRNLDKPKAWLEEIGIKQLGYFADPSAKVFQDLKAIGKALGMPTTLLIDPHGCELGTLAGPAEWASEDAIRLIEAAKARS
jgi:thiol-disulfide isomerase/thioredoxin